MRLAFDSHLFLGEIKTGIPWCADNLIKELSKYNDVQLVANGFVRDNSDEQVSHITYYEKYGVEMNLCRTMRHDRFLLLNKIFHVPYDYFHHSNADITIFFNYLVPYGAAGKKVVFVYDMCYKSVPETMDERNRRKLDLTLKNSCKLADAIVTISEFSKKEIIKYLSVPEDKVTVIPLGAKTDLYNPDYKDEEIEKAKERYHIDNDYFLYLGTLEPRKNIIRIVEAYNEYRKQTGNPILLVLAGAKGWKYESIFEKVKEYNLEKDIIFTGYLEEKDCPLLMKGATAFVFPSLYEGFGLPPLEAMACGTPVISSTAASLPEVVGNAGILVDPLSTEQLTKAMVQVANDGELRKNLTVKGLERAKQFTWRRSAECLMRLLESLNN